MSSAPTTLGLIVPLPSSSPDPLALLKGGVVDSLWVRDLPVVSAEDSDGGQGSDPWWCLGSLTRRGVALPDVIGTSSIILGIRHPLVVARAAVGAQVDTGGRFVLGVGSGGKPEMNQALGIAGRSHTAFARQWAELRAALSDHFGETVDRRSLSLHLPRGFRPPPMYLATSDVTRWQAIDGDADGWQTFLTDDRHRFDQHYERVRTLRGAETPTDVRLDVELVPDEDAGPEPVFTVPARGRVRCSTGQLPALVKPWLEPPVDRILLRLSGPGAGAALTLLREGWPPGAG